MKQYSTDEILSQIEIKGGDELEQAAALAVVASAIKESRRLGRIALGKPRSSWHQNAGKLRGDLNKSWTNSTNGKF